MDSATLNNRLRDRMADVVSHLYPSAKIKGNIAHVGDIEGGKGDSLQIHVSGAKVGMFTDFAHPEVKGASALMLWSRAKGLTYSAAIKEAKEWMGIKDDDYGLSAAKPKKTYSAPDKKGLRALDTNTKAMDYLCLTRRLCPIAVADNKISETPDGEIIVFPYIDEATGKACHLKYLAVDREKDPETGKEKKKMWASKDTKRCLFSKQTVKPTSASLVITEGECYSADTEVMTPDGWVKIECLRPNTSVLQVHQDGTGSFVIPSAIIQKSYAGDMAYFKSPQVDLLVTPQHNMAVQACNGSWEHIKACDVNRLRIIMKCATVDGPGIPLTDDQIRFCLAVSADSKIDIRKTGGKYGHFGIKKSRKKERLEALMSGLGINCLITHGKGADGLYSYYSLTLPSWVPGRMLPWSWVGLATKAQRELILEELVHWDGNRVHNRKQTEFSSKYQENAAWVQAIASTCGAASTIVDRSNEHGEWKKVSILHGKKTACIGSQYREIVSYTGIVYCVTVDTGMILVRRNGKISVCGNCDAMSYQSLGVDSVSIPMGVNDQEWIDIDWNWLERFETIYLSFDMDAAGNEAVERIAKRLGIHRIRVVSLPHKDMNKCLQEGFTAADAQRVLDESKAIEIKEIQGPSAYLDEVWDVFNPGSGAQGYATPWFPKLPLRIRPGELTLISGYDGCGKTNGINHLINCLVSQGAKVLDCSLEIKPARTLQWMARQALNKRRPDSKEELEAALEWLSGGVWLFDYVGTANVARMFEAMLYAVKRYGVNVIFIDSLFKCGVGSEDYNGQKEFIAKLCDFCRDTNIHIFLVAHSRKPPVNTGGKNEDRVPSKDEIAGSGDIKNGAFNILIWWRNKAKHHKLDELRDAPVMNMEAYRKTEEQPDGRIKLDKQRFGDGVEREIATWFDASSTQFLCSREEKPVTYFTYRRA